MRRMTLLTVCSMVLAGCGVPRPDAELCVVNAPAKHRKCYNLRDDYDDTGKLIPTASPSFAPVEKIDDLNKHTTMDPESWTKVKAYIKKLREAQGGN